jgi:hypothetical protein
MLLVPADPLRPRRPDEHFRAEALAAREAGFDVAVVDHNALTRPDGAEAAVASVPAGDEAVYRGWMLRSERYAAFAGALARRGLALRTSAEQYQRAHELPGWYAALAAFTPASVWTTGTTRADFDRARVELGGGAAVLRDYTKSMKHYWHEAAFIPDLADGETAERVASRLLDLRDDDFVGGFVLRRFERFAPAEVRTWWVNGGCVLVSSHPDTPNDAPPGRPDLDAFAPAIAALGLPFITVDLALRTDGVWRIIEIGDGQVSDRPTTTEPSALIAALLAGTP